MKGVVEIWNCFRKSRAQVLEIKIYWACPISASALLLSSSSNFLFHSRPVPSRLFFTLSALTVYFLTTSIQFRSFEDLGFLWIRNQILWPAMEELKSAVYGQIDQMADLIEKLSAQGRVALQPAIDHFICFFHAIDWTEPWLISLLSFHVFLLLVTIISRKNLNFQMCLFLLALAVVYLAERINTFLAIRWKSFSTQNYFDPHGTFLSVLWSGPLLCIAVLILINTLFSLCQLIVRWKRADLRHRARLASSKQD